MLDQVGNQNVGFLMTRLILRLTAYQSPKTDFLCCDSSVIFSKIEDIQNKGRGVVATKPFRRGDFVVEYAGDRINIPEAKEREAKYSKKSDIGCYMYYFTFKNRQYW